MNTRLMIEEIPIEKGRIFKKNASQQAAASGDCQSSELVNGWYA
jgi:hypothetical protein